MSILEKIAVVFMIIITIVWAYAIFIWRFGVMKILIILSLLLLVACSSNEVYKSLDTRAGFDVVDGKIVPSMSADFEKQINFMEDK